MAKPAPGITAQLVVPRHGIADVGAGESSANGWVVQDGNGGSSGQGGAQSNVGVAGTLAARAPPVANDQNLRLRRKEGGRQ